MNARVKNHLALFMATGISLGVAAISGPGAGAADRLSIVSAYVCLVLLGVALLIGPLNVLQQGRLVSNSYVRRDTGIWAALNGLLHFYLANVLSMNYEYLALFVDNAALPPSAAIRNSLYSLGTIIGFFVAVLFIVLLLLSSDWMLRKLGLKWWKRIQRVSYLVFALTVLHALAFQVLETRALVWVIAVFAITALILVGQYMGFMAVKRNMPKAQWRSLSVADARSRKLYGFGGWLITFYVIAAFLLVWQLFGALSTGDGLLKMFGNADNAAIMRVVLIIKALSWLPFLILAPLRKPSMPAVTIVCVLATFLLECITVNFYLGLPAIKLIGVNVFNALIAFSFVTYLIASARVDTTYRLREPAAAFPKQPVATPGANAD
jgi:sulfoxide reductase heme-binding subunit YedZ